MSVPPESAGPPPPPTDDLPPAPVGGMPSHEERQWALFAHLSALLGYLVTGHFFGIGCFLGPLVIWLVKKDSMPFVADQAKEALNFNITVFIIGCVLVLFSIVTFGIGLLLAWPLGIALFVGWVVLTIIAAIKANEGTAYRYPWTLRLVK